MDFAARAKQLLDSLADDPERGPPETDATTFPLGDAELEGEVGALDPDSEFPTFDVGARPRDDDVSAARQAYRDLGIDTLAFYKSFRFVDRAPFAGKWGVFLLDVGATCLSDEFLNMAPSLPRFEADRLATATLLAHERYHFWIDVWALGQESLPVLTPRIKRYEYYAAERPNFSLTDHDVEERLANHYAYRQLRSHKLSTGSPAGALIRSFFEQCPKPYSEFSFGSAKRAEIEGELAAAVSNGINPWAAWGAFMLQGLENVVGMASPSIRPAPPAHPFVSRSDCPVYRVWVYNYAARVQPFLGPPLKEFRQFVENYLAGQKERTDHDFYRIDNGSKIKFPNPHDKEVRGYELKNVLLKAGMTHKEFVRERESTDYWRENCPRADAKPPLGT